MPNSIILIIVILLLAIHTGLTFRPKQYLPFLLRNPRSTVLFGDITSLDLSVLRDAKHFLEHVDRISSTNLDSDSKNAEPFDSLAPLLIDGLRRFGQSFLTNEHISDLIYYFGCHGLLREAVDNDVWHILESRLQNMLDFDSENFSDGDADNTSFFPADSVSPSKALKPRLSIHEKSIRHLILGLAGMKVMFRTLSFGSREVLKAAVAHEILESSKIPEKLLLIIAVMNGMDLRFIDIPIYGRRAFSRSLINLLNKEVKNTYTTRSMTDKVRSNNRQLKDLQIYEKLSTADSSENIFDLSQLVHWLGRAQFSPSRDLTAQQLQRFKSSISELMLAHRFQGVAGMSSLSKVITGFAQFGWQWMSLEVSIRHAVEAQLQLQYHQEGRPFHPTFKNASFEVAILVESMARAGVVWTVLEEPTRKALAALVSRACRRWTGKTLVSAVIALAEMGCRLEIFEEAWPFSSSKSEVKRIESDRQVMDVVVDTKLQVSDGKRGKEKVLPPSSISGDTQVKTGSNITSNWTAISHVRTNNSNVGDDGRRAVAVEATTIMSILLRTISIGCKEGKISSWDQVRLLESLALMGATSVHIECSGLLSHIARSESLIGPKLTASILRSLGLIMRSDQIVSGNKTSSFINPTMNEFSSFAKELSRKWITRMKMSDLVNALTGVMTLAGGGNALRKPHETVVPAVNVSLSKSLSGHMSTESLCDMYYSVQRIGVFANWFKKNTSTAQEASATDVGQKLTGIVNSSTIVGGVLANSRTSSGIPTTVELKEFVDALAMMDMNDLTRAIRALLSYGCNPLLFWRNKSLSAEIEMQVIRALSEATMSFATENQPANVPMDAQGNAAPSRMTVEEVLTDASSLLHALASLCGSFAGLRESTQQELMAWLSNPTTLAMLQLPEEIGIPQSNGEEGGVVNSTCTHEVVPQFVEKLLEPKLVAWSVGRGPSPRSLRYPSAVTTLTVMTSPIPRPRRAAIVPTLSQVLATESLPLVIEPRLRRISALQQREKAGRSSIEDGEDQQSKPEMSRLSLRRRASSPSPSSHTIDPRKSRVDFMFALGCLRVPLFDVELHGYSKAARTQFIELFTSLLLSTDSSAQALTNDKMKTSFGGLVTIDVPDNGDGRDRPSVGAEREGNSKNSRLTSNLKIANHDVVSTELYAALVLALRGLSYTWNADTKSIGLAAIFGQNSLRLRPNSASSRILSLSHKDQPYGDYLAAIATGLEAIVHAIQASDTPILRSNKKQLIPTNLSRQLIRATYRFIAQEWGGPALLSRIITSLVLLNIWRLVTPRQSKDTALFFDRTADLVHDMRDLIRILRLIPTLIITSSYPAQAPPPSLAPGSREYIAEITRTEEALQHLCCELAGKAFQLEEQPQDFAVNRLSISAYLDSLRALAVVFNRSCRHETYRDEALKRGDILYFPEGGNGASEVGRVVSNYTFEESSEQAGLLSAKPPSSVIQSSLLYLARNVHAFRLNELLAALKYLHALGIRFNEATEVAAIDKDDNDHSGVESTTVAESGGSDDVMHKYRDSSAVGDEYELDDTENVKVEMVHDASTHATDQHSTAVMERGLKEEVFKVVRGLWTAPRVSQADHTAKHKLRELLQAMGANVEVVMPLRTLQKSITNAGVLISSDIDIDVDVAHGIKPAMTSSLTDSITEVPGMHRQEQDRKTEDHLISSQGEEQQGASEDSWTSLEQLRDLLAKLPHSYVPNAMWACVRRGHNIRKLSEAGLWNLFNRRVASTISDWSSMHLKLSMLLNSYSKLRAKATQVPRDTQLAIAEVLLAEMPSMDARALSNVLFYTARLQWPTLQSALRQRCNVSVRAGTNLSIISGSHNMVAAADDSSMKTVVATKTSAQGINFVPAGPTASVAEIEDIATATGAQPALPSVAVLRYAFLSKCKYMDGAGEFANAFWAWAQLTELSWNDLTDLEIASIEDAMARRHPQFNGRDIATVLGAFRSMGATTSHLSQWMTNLLLEKIEESAVIMDLDAQSTSLALFSLGHMGNTWDGSFNVVMRMALRNCVAACAPVLSSKELYWVLTGLSKLGARWDSFSGSDMLRALSVRTAQLLADPKLLPIGLVSLLASMARFQSNWNDFVDLSASSAGNFTSSSSAPGATTTTMNLDRNNVSYHVDVNMAVVGALHTALPALSDEDMFQVLFSLSRLKRRWTDLQSHLRETIADRFTSQLNEIRSVSNEAINVIPKNTTTRNVHEIEDSTGKKVRRWMPSKNRNNLSNDQTERKIPTRQVLDTLDRSLGPQPVKAKPPMLSRQRNAQYVKQCLTILCRLGATASTMPPTLITEIVIAAVELLDSDTMHFANATATSDASNTSHVVAGSVGDPSLSAAALHWLSLLQVPWSIITTQQRKRIIAYVRSLMPSTSNAHCPINVLNFAAAINRLSILGASWKTFADEATTKSLTDVIGVLLSDQANQSTQSTGSARKSLQLLRTAIERLGGDFASLSKVPRGSRQALDRALVEKLSARVGTLSDPNLLRVVFLLGQRRFPADLLRKATVLQILAEDKLTNPIPVRVLGVMRRNVSARTVSSLLPGQSGKAAKSTTSMVVRASEEEGVLRLIDLRLSMMVIDLTPAEVVALAGSLAKLQLCAKDLPLTLPILVSGVSSLSATLDRRTFVSTLRALRTLGVKWQDLKADEKAGVCAGIARAATARPDAQQFAALLQVLRDFGAPWADLHAHIPIVMRYVVFRSFVSVLRSCPEAPITSTHVSVPARLSLVTEDPASSNHAEISSLDPTSTTADGSDLQATWSAAADCLKVMAAMGAGWAQLGNKASFVAADVALALIAAYQNSHRGKDSTSPAGLHLAPSAEVAAEGSTLSKYCDPPAHVNADEIPVLAQSSLAIVTTSAVNIDEDTAVEVSQAMLHLLRDAPQQSSSSMLDPLQSFLSETRPHKEE